MKKTLKVTVFVLVICAAIAGPILMLNWIFGDADSNRPMTSIYGHEHEWFYVETGEYQRYYFIKGNFGAMASIVGMVVLSVDGVKSVYPEPYTYNVSIAQCYTWAEVHPRIVEKLELAQEEYRELGKNKEALREYLNDKKEKEEGI